MCIAIIKLKQLCNLPAKIHVDDRIIKNFEQKLNLDFALEKDDINATRIDICLGVRNFLIRSRIGHVYAVVLYLFFVCNTAVLIEAMNGKSTNFNF